MATRLLGLGAILIGVAAVVGVSAQHRQPTQAIHVTGNAHQIPFQHLCGTQGADASAEALRKHAAAFGSALNLTPDQLVVVERAVTEACGVMTKLHEEVLAVLTPEQRAKLQEMHKTHGGGH
jgi:hypothetical protein